MCQFLVPLLTLSVAMAWGRRKGEHLFVAEDGAGGRVYIYTTTSLAQ